MAHKKLTMIINSECRWCSAGEFFKEMIEVSRLFKSKAVADLRNIPVGML